MHCREFRNKHVAFVDDLLSAAEMRTMHEHVVGCSSCSRHDTAIRRSLLIVRNLPPIEPSPEFIERLNARLAQLDPAQRDDVIAARPYFSSVGTFAALAAGLGAVAYMSIATARYFDAAQPTAGATPTVAVALDSAESAIPIESAPTINAAPIADAAFVASVPTGIPIWPAVLMAGQAPGHFATMDLRQTETSR